jgi:hypothetical protein
VGAADARATAAVTAAVWRELTERGFVVVEDALDAATVEAAAREAAALREAGLLHCGACEPPDEVGESECGPGGKALGSNLPPSMRPDGFVDCRGITHSANHPPPPSGGCRCADLP